MCQLLYSERNGEDELSGLYKKSGRDVALKKN
jgi:hypothetical protein